jgi:hypothetical protein
MEFYGVLFWNVSFLCVWSRFEEKYNNPISASKCVGLYGLKLNSSDNAVVYSFFRNPGGTSKTKAPGGRYEGRLMLRTQKY